MIEEQLPKDISYKKLYEPEQNIWFLNWILKQKGSYPYLNHIILSTPFTVERKYHINGLLQQLTIFKNEFLHGLIREWYDTGQIYWEEHWQNSQQHGLEREWYRSGQLCLEENWKNDQRHGLSQGWCMNGQLYLESNWQNGNIISEKLLKN